MSAFVRVIGVDPSLTNCAIISLRMHANKKIEVEYREIVETLPELPLCQRLMRLYIRTRKVEQGLNAKIPCLSYAAVESPPQGARMHNSAMVAQTAGACLMGLRDSEPQSYTAVAAKRFMVPHWHGWSKSNWEKRGYTKKFKRSQPSKTAVASAIARRFDINLVNTDMSDAAALAIYHANQLGLLEK